MLESDHTPLSPATNRAGHVQDGSFTAPARNDERLERLELPLAFIDGVLEGRDAPLVDVRLGEVVVHLLQIRGCQQRTNAEKVALDRDENFIDAGHGFDGAGHTQRRVQLVDVPVGFNSCVVLRNAAAAEESGVARVARFRIDPHRQETTTERVRGVSSPVVSRVMMLPFGACGHRDCARPLARVALHSPSRIE